MNVVSRRGASSDLQKTPDTAVHILSNEGDDTPPYSSPHQNFSHSSTDRIPENYDDDNERLMLDRAVGFQKHNPDTNRILFCLLACFIFLMVLKGEGEVIDVGGGDAGVDNRNIRGRSATERALPRPQHQKEEQQQLREIPPLQTNLIDLWTAKEAEVAAYKKSITVGEEFIKTDPRFMETDPRGKTLAAELQDLSRQILDRDFGKEPRYIVMEMEFPEVMGFGSDSIKIQLAPQSLLPYSVLKFLNIASAWSTPEKPIGGKFHRNANHVLQAMTTNAPGGKQKGLAFQEYSPDYPHVQRTLGYAGRPSGPAFYISLINNSKNHGPGSQQKYNPHEADSNFGKVVEGWDEVVIAKMKKQPGAEGGNSFVRGNENHILITNMIIETS